MADAMRSSLNSDDIPAGGESRQPAIRPAGSATFTNPVLDADFPDPAIILAPDGYYYAYATQTLRDGHWINIQVARSIDLIHWEHLGDALPQKPDWARPDCSARFPGRRTSGRRRAPGP